jgi:hypothetical protein
LNDEKAGPEGPAQQIKELRVSRAVPRETLKMFEIYVTGANQQAPSWRDVLPIHPAAELFPLLPSDDLRALGKDIIENGLTCDITLWRADPKAPPVLLDGRNRLDAIEMATGKPVEVGAPSLMAGKFTAIDKVNVLDGRSVDPWVYVVSANIHRRHLTAEQKREIVAELLKANPQRSNNATAKLAKVDDKTVGAVRADLERRSEIPNVKTRTDSKGRQQPAKKATKKTQKKKKKPAESEPVESTTTTTTVGTRDDIGATSAGEVERLEARIRELEHQKRCLELKIVGLESENDELKTENAALRAKLEAAVATHHLPPSGSVAQEAAAAASSAISPATNTATASDPGPIPDFLPREPKTTSASDSNGGTALGDAVAHAFGKLRGIGDECCEQVENAPPGIDQSPRYETLDDTARVLGDLTIPVVPVGLAAIRVNLPKRRKARSRGERRDAQLGIIDACAKALGAIDEKDLRHEEAHALCDALKAACAEAEECEFF